MTVYAPTLNSLSFSFATDSGLSQDARDVRRIQSVNNDSSNSLFEFLKMQSVHQISSALAIASQNDWDGYQAVAADVSTFSYALSFINQLPLNYPLPEAAIDSDGEIAFEWDYEPRRIFSVRIGRDGWLNYAGLIGHSSFHGVEIMRDKIPSEILNGIERVANNKL
jgi:hypothetical protein